MLGKTKEELVRIEEELAKAKGQINQNLLANPEFESIVQGFYYEYNKVKMYIYENGSFIRMLSDIVVKRDDLLPRSETTVLDIKLNEKGEMNVTRSFGTLFEAKKYYHDISQTRPDYATSVLVAQYHNCIYNSNGIILSRVNYYPKPGDLDNVRFDDEERLQSQLLSEGLHKPREWYYNRLQLPTLSENAQVNYVYQTELPGIAGVGSYDVDVNGFCQNIKNQLGKIRTDSPASLIVDNYWGIFANFDSSKQEYVLTPEYAIEYPQMTTDEVENILSQKYISLLEDSNLKSSQYNGLVEMINDRSKKTK